MRAWLARGQLVGSVGSNGAGRKRAKAAKRTHGHSDFREVIVGDQEVVGSVGCATIADEAIHWSVWPLWG